MTFDLCSVTERSFSPPPSCWRNSDQTKPKIYFSQHKQNLLMDGGSDYSGLIFIGDFWEFERVSFQRKLSNLDKHTDKPKTNLGLELYSGFIRGGRNQSNRTELSQHQFYFKINCNKGLCIVEKNERNYIYLLVHFMLQALWVKGHFRRKWT